MDGATVIGLAQVALLFGIAVQLGGLREVVKDHGRRIGLLERKK